MPEQPAAFTGRVRDRRTRRGVLVADRLSRSVITVGGIGTIVAVLFILFFLVAVVAPLFGGAQVRPVPGVRVAGGAGARPLRLEVDDFGVASWELDGDGALRVRRLDTGEVVEERSLFEPGAMTSLSQPGRDGTLAIGLRDGGVVLGRIGFDTLFREPDAPDLPEGLRDLPEGRLALWEKGVVQRTPAGQLRRQTLAVELADPVAIAPDAGIVLVDRTDTTTGPVCAALTADGTLHVRSVREKKNMMTGKVKRTVRGGDVEIERHADGSLPRRLLLSGLGDQVFLVWEDGYVLRYGARDLDNLQKVEARSLLEGTGARVVDLVPLVGKSTFVVADTAGRLLAYFLATSSAGETSDGMTLLLGHEIEAQDGGFTTLAASLRSRTVAAGTASGRVELYFVTSEKLLADVGTERGAAIEEIAFGPRDDALFALSDGVWHRWSVQPGHPEATLKSLVGKLHYEGYERPEYVWQSSGGTDADEMKISLVPLIFGTLKATLFSMLFAVPLALLAALYTSEFLHPRVRPRIKAVVEVMASLPSVVLGFIAAYVLAPFVEDVVPVVLLAFATLPFAFVLGANLWQMVPRKVALGLERHRLGFIALVVPVGILLAILLGPVMEDLYFAGDIKGWLDGRVGGATGGWALIFLPLGVVLAILWLRPLADFASRRLEEKQAAGLSLARLFLTGGAALGISWGLAWVLGLLSIDTRDGLFGTYKQSNAVVVGLAMGFAVIPIIYTLAEDALSSVPQHLRAASLGAGATPWQTAVRIVMPTAASSPCSVRLEKYVSFSVILLTLSDCET